MGTDGHTASIFPKSKALKEKERLALKVPAPKLAPKVPRITLTLPAINASSCVIMLISGEEKRQMAKLVLDAIKNGGNDKYPASLVQPKGEFFIYKCDNTND